jgi:uncharacterized protein YecE (DUF72 family)
MNQVKVGCCGFPVRREKYFQQFRLVEVQQTFYNPPNMATVVKWHQDAPQDFEFTLKAWQVITHPSSSPTYRKTNLAIPADKKDNYGLFRPSDEVLEAWTKTRDIAQILEAKFVVFQCPAKFIPSAENIANMRHFFTKIDREGFIFVWEPRGEWDGDIIAVLCRDLDLICCVNPLERAIIVRKLKYFRLHGGRDYRHQYNDKELSELRRLSGDEAYVLFNNITMYQGALRFKELIR